MSWGHLGAPRVSQYPKDQLSPGQIEVPSNLPVLFYYLTMSIVYSDPDQPARFAAQKAADDSRALRIEEHFQPGRLAGQRILITGSNRGIGLSLATEAKACKYTPCSPNTPCIYYF